MPGGLLHNVDPIQPLRLDHPHAQGLVGMWKVMPWTGGFTQLRDLTQYRNHGTLNGYAATDEPWHAGRRGLGAIELDGTTDVSIPNIAVTHMSVCAWCRRTSGGGIVGRWHGSGVNERNWMLGVSTSSLKARVIVSDDGTWAPGVHSTDCQGTTVLDSDWYWIVGTYRYVGDGTSQIRVYVDGQLDGWTDLAQGPIGTNGTVSAIGSLYDEVYWVGWLDDVRIYNRVLSAKQITSIYHDTLSGEYSICRRAVKMPTIITPASPPSSSAHRILSMGDIYNDRPFEGSGTSVYGNVGNAVKYRNLRIVGRGRRGVGGKRKRRHRIKGAAGVHDIAATTVQKTARLASVDDPAETVVYDIPAAWAGETVTFDVRRFADDVENLNPNYRTVSVDLDSEREDDTGINGTATILAAVAYAGGDVRLRFLWFPARDGATAVKFTASATAGPDSPVDVVADFSTSLLGVPRTIEIDLPSLSDSSAYTYKITAADSTGTVTADVITGWSVQADASGPPAPTAGDQRTV